MSKNEWKRWLGVVGRTLLAYALVFAQGAWATQNQATKGKAASPQKAVVQQANEKQSAAATTPVAQTKQAQGEESESVVAEVFQNTVQNLLQCSGNSSPFTGGKNTAASKQGQCASF